MLACCLAFFANSSDGQETCVSINQNIDNIIELKASGKYRQEKQSSIKAFNFTSDLPYSAYLSHSRKYIEAKSPKSRMSCPINNDLTRLLYPERKTKDLSVVDFVAPFELTAQKSKVGILLIHGLTDSPFLFHDLAAKFHQQGMNVRTLLLPGHGTAPSALVDVEYQQWQAATQYAINQMLHDYDKVYLGGFSTGGALIIDYLVSEPSNAKLHDKVAGLIMWSPASKAKSSLAWLAQYVDYLPFMDYVNKSADIDFAKYESFPFNAGAQVHKLMNRISADKLADKQIPDIPLMIITSDVDQTIDTQSSVAMFDVWHTAKGRTKSTNDTFLLYSQDKNLLSLPNNLPIELVNCDSKKLCEDIVDIAHTSPTNAPNNTHYGRQGVYRNCEHQLDEAGFKQCKTVDRNIAGEVTESNREKHPSMQRLTFNPLFEQTWNAITAFIHKTEK